MIMLNKLTTLATVGAVATTAALSSVAPAEAASIQYDLGDSSALGFNETNGQVNGSIVYDDILNQITSWDITLQQTGNSSSVVLTEQNSTLSLDSGLSFTPVPNSGGEAFLNVSGFSTSFLGPTRFVRFTSNDNLHSWLYGSQNRRVPLLPGVSTTRKALVSAIEINDQQVSDIAGGRSTVYNLGRNGQEFTESVPEPVGILSSLMMLGLGTTLKRKFAQVDNA